jgi:N-acetyl-gamma-glutamyl-phosphate reductase
MTSLQTYSPGSPRVLVAGASGFAGALAASLIWRHPEFELAAITARSDAGKQLDDMAIFARYRLPVLMDELDLDHLDDIDAAIVAYPHAAAAPTVAALVERGVRVIDLSADFRLADVRTYEEWYGKHPCPRLLETAVYGLTELNREKIASAELVANPGCFPTSALLALAPLAKAGLIHDVVVDAKTGASGAGRTGEMTHYSLISDNVIPYRIEGHRHRPEIEAQLAGLGAPDLRVQFQPHLVAMDQGKLSSCYVTPTRPLSTKELDELFDEAYDQEQFVEVVKKPTTPRDVQKTNFCRLQAVVDSHTGKLLVFSAIDNLWKGTSSQAVQNLNVMFGFDEESGIPEAPQSPSALLSL